MVKSSNQQNAEITGIGTVSLYTILRNLTSGKEIEGSEKMKILDLGCGKRKYPNSIGVDINENFDADVKWDLENVPYPFEDGSIDLIICVEVLEHLCNTKQFISEVSRILKPNGILYLTTNNRKSLINRMFKTYETPSHCSLQTIDSLKKLVSKELVIAKFFCLPYSDQARNDFRYRSLRLFRILLHYILPQSLQERMVVMAVKKLSWTKPKEN